MVIEFLKIMVQEFLKINVPRFFEIHGPWFFEIQCPKDFCNFGLFNRLAQAGGGGAYYMNFHYQKVTTTNYLDPLLLLASRSPSASAGTLGLISGHAVAQIRL